MGREGSDLGGRYRNNYGISDDSILTEEMILRHWELEQCLRLELKNWKPSERWEVFERCYSML